jgi:hypothetical protein
MMRALRMTVAALHQRMNKRFSRLGRRVDARFKEQERRVDARFKAVDARFDAMDHQLRELVRSVQSLTDQFYSRTRKLAADVEHCLRVIADHEERIGHTPPI